VKLRTVTAIVDWLDEDQRRILRITPEKVLIHH
jgi:hypothetical protein